MNFYQFIIYLAEHDDAGILLGIFLIFFVFILGFGSLIETTIKTIGGKK